MKIDLTEKTNFSTSENIIVTNLNPGDIIISNIKCTINNVVFSASCKYRADETGTVIFNESEAFDGVYEGVLTSGLIMHLTNIQNRIFHYNDPTGELEFKLTVTRLDNETNESEKEEKIFYKSYAYGLKYKKIDHKRSHLEIFTKDFSNDVILILSSAQRMNAYDAASFFAEHGFSAVLVKYYNEENLPKECAAIAVEMIEDIKESLNEFTGEKFHVFGHSEGASLLALFMKYYPDYFKKGVFFSASPYIFQGISKNKRSLFTYKGEDLSYIPFKFSFVDQLKLTGKLIFKKPISIRDNYKRCIENDKNRDKKTIGYEDIKQDLLLVVSKDDLLSDNLNQANEIIKKRDVKILEIKKTGHYINAPFFPQYQNHALNTTFGGDIEENAKAAFYVYDEILKFFSE